jgi:methionine-S-sulfoxide reductase
VIRTRVGYAGGTQDNPTYHSLGDHTETLQIDYDPSKLSYAQLLDVFWESHHPEHRAWSQQYKAAVFYHDEEQKRLAMESKRIREQGTRGGPIYTEILPLGRFYRAEDYHQKYRLRRDSELMRALRRFYPDSRDFVDSTAAARINGYLAGNGSLEQLKGELDLFGLSPEAGRRLLAVVQRGKARL